MSASSQAEEATQFTLLTECLTSAVQERETTIILPDEVIAQFKKGIIQDDSSIRDFNKLFACSDHTNRLKLDHSTFSNVVAILLHLRYSLHQEKALFAFIHTIDLFKDPTAVQATLTRAGQPPASAEEIQIKHGKIYNKLIHKMLQILVLKEQEPSMRLMAGHILYALIHSSSKAQELARRYSEKAKLGPVVDHDDDYIVRIFTANVIREMCAETSNPREFWPQFSKKKDEHEDFPVSVMPDSAWLGAVADYLSSKDVSRRFHGNSRPVISKLLSIETGAYTFKDDPGANILAVVGESFDFIVPATGKKPLAMLELALDSQCTCFVDERTSPDNRSDNGEDVQVFIETAKRGYQVYQGTRNALDSAILVLPRYDQGESFAEHASRSLQLVMPQSEGMSANIQTSSRAESRSFRMLAHGMVDVDMEGNSEPESDVVSISNASSIIGTFTESGQRKVSRSRTRQSSRVTEAKLKEAHREMPSKPAASGSQLSLRHGDRQELANQSRSIDPRMLTRRKSNNVQTEMTKDIGMDTGFERYVEQSKDRAENKPARHAKLLHQPSAGLRPDTISSQRVESSPSNRAHRLLSSKRALDLGTNQTRPLRQPLEPERSLVAGRSTKETSEHRRAPQPRTGNEDLEPIELVNKTPAKTTTDLVTQARKTQAALRHTRQSQSATANPMDWNGGDMADESNAHLPAAKKPRLTEATAKSKSRQSLSGARSRAEPTKLDDSGATSILKRPKATKTKSRKSQQTDPKAKHDEFDIEDDEETTAPTSTTGNVAREQGRNAAGKNVKSQASKPAKGAATKPAVKGRKTLQSMDTNKTLAANRPRRSQPKSKKYIDESDSDIENPNEDAEDIPEKTKSNTMAGKRTSIAEHELQEPAVEATLSRQSAEASAKNTNSKLPDQAQSDHEVALAPRIPIQVVAETTEIATTYETLVTASPTRLDETEPQTVGKGRKNAGAMRDAKQQSTQPQETSTRANEDDSPDETAEDSYPKVTTKSQGARVSFGSKLGQFIKPVGGKKDAIAAHITPLSNAKSFVGAVNKTRSTSPKKPRQPEAASISKDNDTGLLENAESTTKDGSSTVSGKGTVPKVHTNEQAAAPSPKNASITNGSSNSTPGPRTAKQHMQRARLCSLKKLPKDQKAILNSGSTSTRGAVGPVTPSVAQQNVEFNDATLGQEDVDALHEAEQNHEIQEEFQLRDRNTPIDLTQDSDEAMSVTGIHQLDHVPTISKVIDNKTTTEARVIEEHDRDKTPAIRQGELVSEQPTQSTRAKLAVTERGTFEKTPQQPKLPHIADPPRRRDPTAVQNELTALRGSTTKKSQLVHFNTQGPQNQGVPSPEKPNRKSAAIQIDTSEAKENVAYKQSRFAAARRNPLIKVPTPQSESTDSADEDYDESGFVVEDDTVMEDVGDAVREGRANPMPEESATVFTSRLLPQGSQSSRVDHNGSPRLSPSHLNHSTQLDDHDMNVAAEFTNENNNVEDDDPTAWTEKSATESEEYASQDSDQSFRLSNKAPNPRQSDRTIRSRTQATATAIPSSKPVEQAERKPAPANMSIKSTPRESLGLSHMVQEQYPQAQKNVATHPFKKPLLRTEVANQLEVSSRLPITGHKAPAQADNLRRQPLKEVSTNSKKPTIADEPPPNYTTEFSSAEPIRFNKPQSKTPRQPYPASETQEETPASLMTTLHVHRADRLDEGEETIRESLNRRKRQSTKDADRTLVEDNNISQYDGRQVDETSSVDSVSPPSEADINTDLRQDDVRWREGSRKAQNGVRDALMEIANTVLIRLESEEKLIERTVESYDTGCGNILRMFQQKQTKMLGTTRWQVLETANGESVKVLGTFARLQEKKRYVRNGDTKDQMQQAVKETERLLITNIEHMLEKLEKDTITGGPGRGEVKSSEQMVVLT